IYLTIEPSDNSALLTMNHIVPWTNYEYRIYRRDPGSTDFNFIGTSVTNTYTDTALVNTMTYCYKVEAYGTYYADDVPALIINCSQDECTMPYDQSPPCAPLLTNSETCEDALAELIWTNPNETCGNDDVMGYNIYYSPTPE